MEVQILNRPGAAAAQVVLQAGESFTAEVGAMISCTTGVNIDTTARKKGSSGGLMKAAKRMFAGENFFLNHFTAANDGDAVIVGPALIGDVIHHRLSGTLIAQGDSWLASSSSIDIDASWQGFGKALFSGESMFWVKCSGDGDLLLNSFGGIYEVDVDGDYTVDTGHIVAFEDTLTFRIGKASKSLIGSFLSGEGLVCKFTGKGKLYCQTHNPSSFGQTLGPNLRPR
jgi:uncharacterized protein (TIGR00266 family)